MSTILTGVTNGVSFGYRGAFGTTAVSDAELIVDFQVGYDIVANLQVLTSAGVVKSLSDAVISYPAEGQVKISQNIISAMALANSLKTVTNAHAADAAEHSTAADATNYPVAIADATDLTTLLALTGALLTAYDAHDADAELASGWAFHGAQEAADHSLTSAVTPTTVAEAVTRLNDLKAKYNAHDADSTAHTTGSTHQEATADATSTYAIVATDVINVLANRNKA